MALHVADSPVVAPARLGLIGLAFFVSGASALAYQVVWQRILALHTGVGITSMALIVAAFMAGLGVGCHLGGRWSERVSCRLADHVLCVSHSVREVVIAERLCPAAKIATLGAGSGNGVDGTARFNPANLGSQSVDQAESSG